MQINGFPVAVPEKIIGLTLFLDFFDRCLSLASLHLPPAALGSLPVFELVAAAVHRTGAGFVKDGLLIQNQPPACNYGWLILNPL